MLRAVENRRSVVRAANGGISCFINPIGFTLSETEMFTKTFLTNEVDVENEITFYTKHPYIIPYLSLFVSIIIIIFFLYLKLSQIFIREPKIRDKVT